MHRWRWRLAFCSVQDRDEPPFKIMSTRLYLALTMALGWSLMDPNGCSSQLAPSHVIETHQIQKIFQEYDAHSRFCRFGFVVSGRKQIKTPGQHKHHKPTDQQNWNLSQFFFVDLANSSRERTVSVTEINPPPGIHPLESRATPHRGFIRMCGR